MNIRLAEVGVCQRTVAEEDLMTGKSSMLIRIPRILRLDVYHLDRMETELPDMVKVSQTCFIWLVLLAMLILSRFRIRYLKAKSIRK